MTDDDEALVAYLDGELPRDERGTLEQRLVNDEALRDRLQSLQKGWDLLDLLPTPVTTEESVQSTLELVVSDIHKYANSNVVSAATIGELPTHPTSRRRQAYGGVASLWKLSWVLPIVLMMVTFGIASLLYRSNSKTRVLDFPVAIDMQAYSLAENTALIEHLSKSSRWRRVVASTAIPDVENLISTDGEKSLFAGDSLSSGPSQKELIRRLGEVPTDQRLIALSRLERFEQLDPVAKQSLRDSALRIRQTPSFQQDLDTLRAYSRWRDQLSDDLVVAIEAETGTAREAAIESAIAETITSIGRSTSRNLSNEAIERLDFTLIQIVKQRVDGENNSVGKSNKHAPTQRLSRFLKQRGELLDDPDAIYRMVAARIVFQNDEREIPPLTTSELELMQAMLPEKDAETLQRYVADPWVRALILEDWAQETLRRKTRGQTKAATLPELYQSLPTDQKEMVDLMPPEKARRWLTEVSP